MRAPSTRRTVYLVLALVLIAAGAQAPANASSDTRDRATDAPSAAAVRHTTGLSARTISRALHAPAPVVRRAGRATVARVTGPTPLYRVTMQGSFPPRALRYSVFAGQRFVGYGIPTADLHELQAVTTDPSVLSRRITTRYGDGGATASGTDLNVNISPPVASLPDPAATGPYAVTRAVYKLGNQVFHPSHLPGKVELVGDVHYPTDLSGGPYPLVLFMHGNHVSCYHDNRVAYEWPCKGKFKPLPNYRGYDYIAQILASWGYIVVSVSANGVNVLGSYLDDTGMQQRGEVLEKHIDIWRRWSTEGGREFGDLFVGAVDLSRIGVMGHSRGGEGAVYNVIVDRSRPSPYGIDAVLALAPVDFTRRTINDVPFDVMLPYCDGDVSDLQGIHFFDDSRYLVPGDPTPKSSVTVMGANHNFFNTVWTPGGGFPGGFDDGQYTGCQDRLTSAEERQVGAAYITGFFRRYLGNETDLNPMWTGEATPDSIAPAKTIVTYLAPDLPDQRMDVARFVGKSELTTDDLGGAVTPTNLREYRWCADTFKDLCEKGDFSFYDVHLTYYDFFGTGAGGLSRVVIGWADPGASLTFDLPPGSRDVSAFDAFQFRAAVNPSYRMVDQPGRQDLAVTLTDGSGNSASVSATAVHGDALLWPIHDYFGHVILNEIRFPLGMFAGVDMTDVRSVQLRLTKTDQGVIDLSDVAFSGDGL